MRTMREDLPSIRTGFKACIAAGHSPLATEQPRKKIKPMIASPLSVIQKIQVNNLAVDVFTFTRSGHWIIVADDTAYYSDESKFDSLKAYDGTSIKQKIKENVIANPTTSILKVLLLRFKLVD